MTIQIDSANKALFVKVLNDPSVPVTERRVYNTAVISCGLAYALPLPNERVALPADFYETNYTSVVKEFISALNEEVVIDIGSTVDITKNIWLNRYTVCYIPSVESAIDLARKVIENTKPYEMGGNVATGGINRADPAAAALATNAPVGLSLPGDTGGSVTLESYLAKHVDTVSQTMTYCLPLKK